jgi:hypothetical protein
MIGAGKPQKTSWRTRVAIALLVCLYCLHAERSIGQDPADEFRLGASQTATVPTTYGVIFEATINGEGPFQLIFDTGAGVNTLNPAVIAELGLPAEGGPRDIPAVGGPVKSQAFHVHAVRVGDLTLHGQSFYSVQMPWPDGTGPVGAVGYEVMRRLVVTIDFQHGRLTFRDPVSFSYRGSGEKVTLEPDETQLVVAASIGKARGDFVIDSGDFGGISVNAWFVKKFDMLRHLPHSYHGVFGAGAGGDTPAEWITRVKTVCIAKSCVHRIIASLSDGQASWDNHAGTIGRDILKAFTLTVDWPHRSLYLERNTERTKPEVFNRSGILADYDETGKGLKVVAVLQNSPGDKAGVKVGDRILRIDNRTANPTWGSDEPEFLKPAGTVITLSIRRGAVTQQVKVRLKNLL